jgi:hypothetical protein
MRNRCDGLRRALRIGAISTVLLGMVGALGWAEGRAETALGVRAGAGPSFPQDELGERAKTGLSLLGVADIYPKPGPLAVTIVAGYQNFPGEVPQDQFRDWYLSGGVHYEFLRRRTVLYGSVGIGPHVQRYESSDWKTRLGVSASLGAAYAVGEAHLFLEFRFDQTLPTDFGARSLPLIAGIWLRP